MGKLESLEDRIAKLENQLQNLITALHLSNIPVCAYPCHTCSKISIKGVFAEDGPHQYHWVCEHCLGRQAAMNW